MDCCPCRSVLVGAAAAFESLVLLKVSSVTDCSLGQTWVGLVLESVVFALSGVNRCLITSPQENSLNYFLLSLGSTHHTVSQPYCRGSEVNSNKNLNCSSLSQLTAVTSILEQSCTKYGLVDRWTYGLCLVSFVRTLLLTGRAKLSPYHGGQ